MIYVYKVEPFDDIKDFNVFTMLRLMSEDKVWAFKYLDAGMFWNNELLTFTENPEGDFIILDDETGVIKQMRIEFGLNVMDEKIISEK